MFSATISGSGTQLISLRVIQDNRSLVAIMRNGDIITTSLDDEIPLVRSEAFASNSELYI